MGELNLIENEIQQLTDICRKYYMLPVIKKIDSYIESGGNWKDAFDNIHKFMIDSKGDVDGLLEERRKKKLIKSVDQARKSIAGNVFSEIIVYIFLMNKSLGSIRSDLFITSKRSQVPGFNSLVIKVDNEFLKPDCDLIVYSTDPESKGVIILSLKTSLRERAGQTFKWKLLFEIANTENPIRQKYNISYESSISPLICFATVNFYDEINNPQHRGMFKFFDESYIAKDIDAEHIKRLSHFIQFVNANL